MLSNYNESNEGLRDWQQNRKWRLKKEKKREGENFEYHINCIYVDNWSYVHSRQCANRIDDCKAVFRKETKLYY